jgi:hypothetical protein
MLAVPEFARNANRHIDYWRKRFTTVVKTADIAEWHIRGKLHRDGAPAMVCANGDRWWWQHGKLHRDGAPALVCASGDQAWYQHGELHRDGLPAVIRADGTVEHWQNGVRSMRG